MTEEFSAEMLAKELIQIESTNPGSLRKCRRGIYFPAAFWASGSDCEKTGGAPGKV